MPEGGGATARSLIRRPRHFGRLRRAYAYGGRGRRHAPGISVSLKYELDGRQVSQQQFFDGLEGQMRKVALDTVIEQVTELTCPEGFSVQLTGCCDDLIERAEANIG